MIGEIDIRGPPDLRLIQPKIICIHLWIKDAMKNINAQNYDESRLIFASLSSFRAAGANESSKRYICAYRTNICFSSW